MKKKQIIGGVIALIAVYGLYRVFSKPKAIAGGAESERSSGEEGQPSGQGGYSGGGYSGGGYVGGGVQNDYSNPNQPSNQNNSGNGGSGMPPIDLGKFRNLAGPARVFVPPTQPAGSGSAPRTNPYLGNIPSFNTVRDTKPVATAAMAAAANLSSKLKGLNVNVAPQPSFTIGKPRF